MLSRLIKEEAKTVIVKVCKKIIFREAVCTPYHTGVWVQAAVNHRGSLQAFVSAHGIPGLTKAARKVVKQKHTALSCPGFLIDLYLSAVSEGYRWDELPPSHPAPPMSTAHPAALFCLLSFFLPSLNYDFGKAIPNITVFSFLPKFNVERPLAVGKTSTFCCVTSNFNSALRAFWPHAVTKISGMLFIHKDFQTQTCSEMTLPTLRSKLLKSGLVSCSSSLPHAPPGVPSCSAKLMSWMRRPSGQDL